MFYVLFLSCDHKVIVIVEDTDMVYQKYLSNYSDQLMRKMKNSSLFEYRV